MATAGTHRTSTLLEAARAALVGAGWACVLGSQSLREADVASATEASVSFRFTGEIAVSQDTSRQPGPADSVRLLWAWPVELKAWVPDGLDLAAFVADVVETALCALAGDAAVRRACHSLTLTAGQFAVYGTGDRSHAYGLLTLSTLLTHDMNPSRRPAS